uniref:Secreted venom protein family 5 protein n=1 Tax=Pristhesancus plagipennis TaxID=1955184 RepID=A0A2K8JPV0_PRIPG|nr:secreted venom protein family 5 protein [Pristhesancus plagipennis]
MMYKVLLCLLLSLFVNQLRADQIVINQAVDKLLEEAKIILHARGQDKINVPNLDKTIHKTIFGKIQVNGEFHSSGGLFQDLSSLHRTGDVRMNAQGNKLTLSASMGLSKLAIDFSHYSFQLLAIHSEGNIHAECDQNAISAEIALVHNGATCTVELHHAQIGTLEKFDVKMNGPGQLNEVGSLLFTWILNTFNGNLRSVINSHIEGAIRDSLKKVDLCKMIPH